MPICEADPWRLQYFEHAACPTGVNIPTEDSDAWLWYPDHRWVYDKIAIAQSQELEAGPHGVPPPRFPVFSKPIVNLKGMGVGSCVLRSPAEYEQSLTPGHMWMALLEGRHVSSDVAVVDGEPRWWRHVTGRPSGEGTFDYWTVHAAHGSWGQAQARLRVRNSLEFRSGPVSSLRSDRVSVLVRPGLGSWSGGVSRRFEEAHRAAGGSAAGPHQHVHVVGQIHELH